MYVGGRLAGGMGFSLVHLDTYLDNKCTSGVYLPVP